jgi:hypothetical protein
VVYPSRRTTAARGVVSFAGGWTVERCDARIRFNADTFAAAGRAARLPATTVGSAFAPIMKASSGHDFLARLGLGGP